jgi:hypothetical protein
LINHFRRSRDPLQLQNDLTIPKSEDLLKRVQAVYEPEYTDSTKKIVTLRRKKVFKPLVDPLLLEFAQMSLW